MHPHTTQHIMSHQLYGGPPVGDEISMKDVLSPATPPVMSADTLLKDAEQRRLVSEGEQMLASKLQETYRCIVKMEAECQNGCSEINRLLVASETGPEISVKLWVVYRDMISLLDFYYDFMLYALRPSSAEAGRQIVTIYKIPRRMWVYGIVGFLEVLKNVASIFIEYEICACFIAYSFNIISCLTDSSLEMEGWWAEKLGDLSRMAIALYPTRFIDWKVSSEFWYHVAMRTQFGHGKIYYHMCTVQQDNLDALVNIGKSVTCRDAFVPTPEYLKMVVDNICNQRNILSSVELPLIDFIKAHRAILSHDVTSVSHYAKNFSTDFFVNETSVIDPMLDEKRMFWFQKGSSFALCNITQLIGFGDGRNPFAKLFGLPEALIERRDKRDKKRKPKHEEHEVEECSLATELAETQWVFLINYINKSGTDLSMRMLRNYAEYPDTGISTPHVIVWLYFLVSADVACQRAPASRALILSFINKMLPWRSLCQFLNRCLTELRSSRGPAHDLVTQLCMRGSDFFAQKTVLEQLSSEESLYECWQCWGTLWFDFISPKSDYGFTQESGIPSTTFFDIPQCGPLMQDSVQADRLARIVILALVLTESHSFALGRSTLEFTLVTPKTCPPLVNSYAEDPVFAGLTPPLLDMEPVTTENLTSAFVEAPSAVEEEDDATLEGENFSGDMGEFMDTAVTLVTLDTQMWLKHCGRIYKCLRSGILRIGIPLTVFQELRSLRRCNDPIVSDAATRAVITIRQLHQEESSLNLLRFVDGECISDPAPCVVAIRSDGSYADSLNETLEFEANSGWRSSADDLIITSVKFNHALQKGLLMGEGRIIKNHQLIVVMGPRDAELVRYNILVSEDRNLRLKARGLGVIAYQSDWLWHFLESVPADKCNN